MAIAHVNGLNIGYDLIGDGNQPWVLTPGGRYPRDTPGLPQLAAALAEGGNNRVLIWDRPNAGESDVCFKGNIEAEMHADTLAALLQHLDMSPAIIAGGSSGARCSMFTAQRHPDVASALALWWPTGGPTGLFVLGNVYCVPSASKVWAGGMEAVLEVDDWVESVKRNPSNRQRILEQDPVEFLRLMERWMMSYVPRDDETIPGLSDAKLAMVDKPTIVFNSSQFDPNHPKFVSEAVARIIPNAELVPAPYGDREWDDRVAAMFASETFNLFERWPLYAPKLLEWAATLS